jgi:cell wall-associated NlpC family hydrolase
LSAQVVHRRTDTKGAVRILTLAAASLFSLSPLAAGAATITNVGGVQVIVDRPAATPAPARKVRHHVMQRTLAVRQAVVPVQPAYMMSARTAALLHYALGFVGVPYVWGGSSPSGFDCSGYVQYVYNAAGVRMPRTADIQYAVGVPVVGYPIPGDLVFFQTYEVGASHVGIYLGNGWFVQAIRPAVHLSNFNSSYFRNRYIGARRFLAS